jgi:uncharacterized protein
MKESKFNTFFYYEDRNYVGYNALANDFIGIDADLYELFITSVKNNNILKLKDIHFDFYKCLYDKGFIVEDSIDEIQKVKDLVHTVDKETDWYYNLMINPTMNCNFKCWYCYETHVKGSKMTEKEMGKVVKLIENILRSKSNLKRLYVSWFGGEPLLYFHQVIIPLSEKILLLTKSHNVEYIADFTSNGFLITKDVINLCKIYNVKRFQITLDGHKERHNKVRFVSKNRGSYDEIINNIKMIAENEIAVNVRINISKETLENIDLIIQDFSDISSKQKQYIQFDFHKVWQEEEDLYYDIDSKINLFKIKGLHVRNSALEDSVRNSCYADKSNQVLVNYNGDVYKCTARNFTKENREGVLLEDGSISWNVKFDIRMDVKFKNSPCLDCKIMPICGGGCSQMAIEGMGQNYCIYEFNENKMVDIVRKKYLSVINV